MMGETSAIEWTDATVNFWWGCTKVGPGCDHCYAESFDKRVGGAHWGTGVPRRKIASAANTLAKLNRQGGKRVFIQSMSDLFDNEVPTDWFAEAWEHIRDAHNCRIQIVTKRISMVEKRIASISARPWPQHAGLIISVVNQAEADRDIPRLLALKAKLGIPWVGLSMEPLLGPVDLHSAVCRAAGSCPRCPVCLGGIDWVIIGGESGPKARPMQDDWARSILAQCKAAGVPAFLKQMGGKRKPFRPIPEDMMVREFPDGRA
jgi:protein gp37